MGCYLVGARTKDKRKGVEILPFFVYKNKSLNIVNKFGWIENLKYICGVEKGFY
jgi:hypothetical protein